MRKKDYEFVLSVLDVTGVLVSLVAALIVYAIAAGPR